MSKNILYYCRVRYLNPKEFALKCEYENSVIGVIPPLYNVEVYDDGTTSEFGYFKINPNNRFLYCTFGNKLIKVCRITEYSSSPMAEKKTSLELKDTLNQYQELNGRIRSLKATMC